MNSGFSHNHHYISLNVHNKRKLLNLIYISVLHLTYVYLNWTTYCCYINPKVKTQKIDFEMNCACFKLGTKWSKNKTWTLSWDLVFGMVLFFKNSDFFNTEKKKRTTYNGKCGISLKRFVHEDIFSSSVLRSILWLAYCNLNNRRSG